MWCAPSAATRGRVGIVGHVGVGHVYSHSDFMQDDSGGFATLLTLLRQACPCDITVSAVSLPDPYTVCVETVGGGVGIGRATHPFTPSELRLMRFAEGKCSTSPQGLATQCLGRVCGHGAGRHSTAFTLALSRALADTLRATWPMPLEQAPEDIPGCCGEYLGGVLDIDGLACAWLLTINAAEGGIGPNEDGEGCVPIGNKGLVMQRLGLDTCPIIVLESKVIAPALSSKLSENTLFVRWNDSVDNPVVGHCLSRACQQEGCTACVLPHAYARSQTDMAQAARTLGQRISALGDAYAKAATSAEKVKIMATLSDICARDSGGTIFMSNAIHALVGNGGLWPGLGAVLSLLAAPQQQPHGEIYFTEEELLRQARVVAHACRLLGEEYEAAMRYVTARRRSYSPDELLQWATPSDA